MIGQYHVTALIPARGGSKRLPRKNVKLFCGKPLIAWTIEAAKYSQYIDSIVVSTDDVEIKTISENYGANVPFIRPDYLSSDTASSFDVIKHAIEELGIISNKHLVVLLQPTSPLRTTNNIDRALEVYLNKGAAGLVSVSKCEHSPLWANTLPENFLMADFLRPEVLGKRSQDLPNYYRLNGSIYIYNVLDLFKKSKIFFDENVYAFEIDSEEAIDIDTKMDFLIAETIMQYKMNSKY